VLHSKGYRMQSLKSNQARTCYLAQNLQLSIIHWSQLAGFQASNLGDKSPVYEYSVRQQQVLKSVYLQFFLSVADSKLSIQKVHPR